MQYLLDAVGTAARRPRWTAAAPAVLVGTMAPVRTVVPVGCAADPGAGGWPAGWPRVPGSGWPGDCGRPGACGRSRSVRAAWPPRRGGRLRPRCARARPAIAAGARRRRGQSWSARGPRPPDRRTGRRIERFHLVGDELPAFGAVPVVGGTPDGGQQIGPERALRAAAAAQQWASRVHHYSPSLFDSR